MNPVPFPQYRQAEAHWPKETQNQKKGTGATASSQRLEPDPSGVPFFRLLSFLSASSPGFRPSSFTAETRDRQPACRSNTKAESRRKYPPITRITPISGAFRVADWAVPRGASWSARGVSHRFGRGIRVCLGRLRAPVRKDSSREAPKARSDRRDQSPAETQRTNPLLLRASASPRDPLHQDPGFGRVSDPAGPISVIPEFHGSCRFEIRHGTDPHAPPQLGIRMT